MNREEGRQVIRLLDEAETIEELKFAIKKLLEYVESVEEWLESHIDEADR